MVTAKYSISHCKNQRERICKSKTFGRCKETVSQNENKVYNYNYVDNGAVTPSPNFNSIPKSSSFVNLVL